MKVPHDEAAIARLLGLPLRVDRTRTEQVKEIEGLTGWAWVQPNGGHGTSGGQVVIEGAVARPRRARRPVRLRSSAPTYWLVAGLLLLHQFLLIAIHFVLGPLAGWQPRSAGLTATTILVSAFVMGLVVAWDARRPDRSRVVLLVKPTWDRATILTMVLGFVVAQIPLGILALEGATVWQGGAANDLAVGRALTAALSSPAGMVLLLATVVVAPVIEEVLYRGYLAGTVLERSSATLAVLVSAMLFVTLHVELANLVASLCLGIGTGICAVRTRSVVPSILVHVASNAFGMWYATLT